MGVVGWSRRDHLFTADTRRLECQAPCQHSRGDYKGAYFVPPHGTFKPRETAQRPAWMSAMRRKRALQSRNTCHGKHPTSFRIDRFCNITDRPDFNKERVQFSEVLSLGTKNASVFFLVRI